MSGHSKWHNIQAKKGKADAARGKIFTKLGRELLIAVKEGGPDPAGNSKLKNVIAKCKAANMPNDTINNAIKKASSSNENYEEIYPDSFLCAGRLCFFSLRNLDLFSEESGQSGTGRRGTCCELSETLSDDLK